MTAINDHLVLVCGESACGKSASFKDMDKPEGVMYFNCESGKRLPFPAKFQQFTILSPEQVTEGFDYAETLPNTHTLIIDSLTYLMDMFEAKHIYNNPNGQKAWGDYAMFLRNLMLTQVARSTKNVIFTAHTLSKYNEKEMCMQTSVPVKGSSKNTGVESFFSLVISAKKMPTIQLEKFQSALLTVTPHEEALGFKYVFQTQLTKETVNERIRGPIGMFSTQETFMDNNIQLVLNRLKEYYP